MNIVEIVEEHSGGKNGQKINAVVLDICMLVSSRVKK